MPINFNYSLKISEINSNWLNEMTKAFNQMIKFANKTSLTFLAKWKFVNFYFQRNKSKQKVKFEGKIGNEKSLCDKER